MNDYIQHIKLINGADIMKTGEHIQFLCGMIREFFSKVASV